MPPKDGNKGKSTSLLSNQEPMWAPHLGKDDFNMEHAIEHKATIPPRGHLSLTCTHALEQGADVPKTVDELIVVRINEVVSTMLEKFDVVLASQRKTEKAVPRRLYMKDSKWTSKTHKKLLFEGSKENNP